MWWSDGIFVGIHRMTNQYLVYDAVRGIRQARTVMRFPDELKFDVDMAHAGTISPQHIHESEAHDAAFGEPIFPQAPFQASGRTRGHSRGFMLSS